MSVSTLWSAGRRTFSHAFVRGSNETAMARDVVALFGATLPTADGLRASRVLNPKTRLSVTREIFTAGPAAGLPTVGTWTFAAQPPPPKRRGSTPARVTTVARDTRNGTGAFIDHSLLLWNEKPFCSW